MLTKILKNANKITHLTAIANLFQITTVKKATLRPSTLKNLYKSQVIDVAKSNK